MRSRYEPPQLLSCRGDGLVFAEPESGIADATVFGPIWIGFASRVASGSIRSRCEIGRYCRIGRAVTIGSDPLDTGRASISNWFDPDRAEETATGPNPDARRVRIGHDVMIGDGAIVRDGVTIGTGAVIDAGAVVDQDVSPYTVVAGVPARTIRVRFAEDVVERLLESRWWSLDPSLVREIYHDDPTLLLDRLAATTRDGRDYPASHEEMVATTEGPSPSNGGARERHRRRYKTVETLPSVVDLPPGSPMLYGEDGSLGADEFAPKSYENVRIVPNTLADRAETRWWRKRTQGLFLEDGRHIDSVVDYRGSRRIFPPELFSERLGEIGRFEPVDGEDVYYGGTLYPDFGHILLDLTRAYQAVIYGKSNKKKRKILIHNHKWPNDTVVRDWFSLAFDRVEIQIIDRPLMVGKLKIYDPLFFTSKLFDPNIHNILPRLFSHKLPFHAEIPSRACVYVSRSRLKGGTTGYANEEELVTRLISAGIPVIFPEELNFHEKLRIFHTYETIIGFPQSFFHLRNFLPKSNRSKIVYLLAGKETMNVDFLLMEKLGGYGSMYFQCEMPEAADVGKVEMFQRVTIFDVEAAFRVVKALHDDD